jgi:hypothetical protein
MAAVYCKSGNTIAQSLAAAATQEFAFGNTFLSGSGTATNANFTIRQAGTTSRLGILVTSNTVTATSTASVRKNSGVGSETVSIPASTTGYFEDTTNHDSFVSGDTAEYRVTAGSTGTAITFSSLSTTFLANSGTVQYYLVNGTQAFTGTSINDFIPMAGSIYVSTTEAQTQQKNKDTFTYSNMYLHVNTNSRTSTSTVQFRKNGTNANLTLSIAAATTGIFEDTTHTDSIVSGDLTNFEVVLGTGTGTLNIFNAGVECFSSANRFQLLAAGAAAGPASSATLYGSVSGNVGVVSSENTVATKTNLSATSSNMAIFVLMNGTASSSTINFRKNATNGNQTISVPSLTTGYFEDTTHTDAISPSDTIDYSVTSAASVMAQFTFTIFSTLFTVNQTGHLLACLGCGG